MRVTDGLAETLKTRSSAAGSSGAVGKKYCQPESPRHSQPVIEPHGLRTESFDAGGEFNTTKSPA